MYGFLEWLCLDPGGGNLIAEGYHHTFAFLAAQSSFDIKGAK
jgi:hypothetical protein